MPDEDWGRLAQAVAARITALGIKQSDIPARGGPSPAKVREITNRRTNTLSASKRRDLERALEWQLGSIDLVLAGKDPKPITVTIDLDQNNGDLLATLNELLTTGEVTPSSRLMIETLRDDTLIDRFPDLYETLSRTGQLKVARFGQNVYQQEQEHGNSSLSPTKSNAPTEGTPEAGQAQEVTRLPHWGADTPPPAMPQAASLGEKQSDFDDGED